MRWDSYERKFRDLAGKSGAAQESNIGTKKTKANEVESGVRLSP